MKVPQNVLTFLSSHREYYILGHSEPDGDCIGSQIALGNYLEANGKTYRLFSPGPFIRPEIEVYRERFCLEVPEARGEMA